MTPWPSPLPAAYPPRIPYSPYPAPSPCIYNVLPLDNVDNDKLFRLPKGNSLWRNSLRINALAFIRLDNGEILHIKTGASIGQDVHLNTVSTFQAA